MLGRQVKPGRQMRNNQVQHFLYKNFIEEEYLYLREVFDDDPVRRIQWSPLHAASMMHQEHNKKNVSK